MKKNKKHSKESINKESLKYNNRSDFQKFAKDEYEAARRHDVLDSVCSHMKDKRSNDEYYTLEYLMRVSSLYDNKSSFQKGHRREYSYCWMRPVIFKEVCSHMDNILKSHTFNSLQQESLKYDNQKDFLEGSPKEYHVARSRKIISKICSHMTPLRGRKRYERCGVFLYLTKMTHHGAEWVKIGVTKHSVEERYKKDIDNGVEVEVVDIKYFAVGTEGFDTEQEILNETIQHQLYGYNKDGPLKSGCTEIRSISMMSDMIERFNIIKPTLTFSVDEADRDNQNLSKD